MLQKLGFAFIWTAEIITVIARSADEENTTLSVSIRTVNRPMSFIEESAVTSPLDLLWKVTTGDSFNQNTSSKPNSGDAMYQNTWKTLKEYKMFIFFYEYFVYITSVPGLITNPITVYLSTKIEPRTTTELYMFTLGITDLVVVTIRMAFRILLTYNFFWNDVSCKSIYFISNFSYIFSNWILVAWTLERSIAVLFPLKLNSWCTSRKANIILLVFCTLCICIAVPEITEMSSFKTQDNKSICLFSRFYQTTFAMVQNCVYIYIPMIVIFTGNFSVILQLNFLSKARMEITCSREINEKRNKERRQMSRLLIVVASTFIALHVPQIIARIDKAIYPNPNYTFRNNARGYFFFLLLQSIGFQLTDFQNSINFFLYCAFGTKVRKALSQLLFCNGHAWKLPNYDIKRFPQ